MHNQIFCKFGLKRLFTPPKISLWGLLTPKHYFASSTPPKGTSLRENTHVDILIVKIGQPWRTASVLKKRKEQKKKEQKESHKQ